MSRVTARQGTKHKWMGTSKGGRTIKSLYPRTWKKNGHYQKVAKNPRFYGEKTTKAS